jgi:hypothetical protein
VDTWNFIWEIVAAVGTIAVLVGAFLEYGPEVFDVAKRKIHSATIEVETQTKQFGSFLVVVGLAVELVGGVGVIVTAGMIETAHRREIANMQAEFSWRSLSADEQRSIAKSISGFDGRRVRIRSTPGDPEGYALGDDIIAALVKAKPAIGGLDERNEKFVGYPHSVGVQISGPYWERDFIQKLADALSHDGHLENVSNLVADKKYDRKAYEAGEPPQYKSICCLIDIGARPRPRLPSPASGWNQ